MCAPYLMNRLADFNQICMDITFGHDEKQIWFWWPWPTFQGLCGTNLSQNMRVLHNISWTSWWILTRFTLIKHLDMIKSWMGFGDLDLIFKVTARLNPPKLSQKVFVCMLSHGPLAGTHTCDPFEMSNREIFFFK